jgi:hypothetical protein
MATRGRSGASSSRSSPRTCGRSCGAASGRSTRPARSTTRSWPTSRACLSLSTTRPAPSSRASSITETAACRATASLRREALFDAVRAELDTVRAPDDSYRLLAPSRIQTRLRQQMLPLHPWLGAPTPERITASERSLDRLRFVAFAVVALFVLSLPGFALALLLPPGSYLIIIGVLAAIAFYLYRRMRDPLPGTDVPTAFSFGSFLRRNLPMIAGYVAAALLVLVPVAMLVSYLLSLIGGGAPMTLASSGADPGAGAPPRPRQPARRDTRRSSSGSASWSGATPLTMRRRSTIASCAR